MTDDFVAESRARARRWGLLLLAVVLFMAVQFSLGDSLGVSARALGFFLVALVLYPNARALARSFGRRLPFAWYGLVWLAVCAVIAYVERVVHYGAGELP